MNLPYDITEASDHLSRRDTALGALIERAGPCVLTTRPISDLYHPLLRAIIYQQLSGKAAATIHGRVLALAGPAGDITPEFILGAPDELLRGAGMSRGKIAAARDLAAKVSAGLLPTVEELEGMPDDEIVRRLTTVRGIGPWTAEMLLIFNLGRPDVLPLSDLGVRKGFMLTYGGEALPTADQLRAAGEAWRPFRSVASWYFWRAADFGQG